MSITIAIIIITVLTTVPAFPEGVRAIDVFRRADLFHKLKFNAYMVIHRKEWWRMLTSGFLHVGWWHLFFNMMTLYFFGRIVEQYFVLYWGSIGRILFFALYIIAIPLSSISDLIKHRNNHYYSAVGASGAVSAILFASIIFEPWIGIMIFPLPFEIPGIVFGPLYLAYSHYMGRRNLDNIGHDAHFWGALVGFILPFLLKPFLFKMFIEKVIGG